MLELRCSFPEQSGETRGRLVAECRMDFLSFYTYILNTYCSCCNNGVWRLWMFFKVFEGTVYIVYFRDWWFPSALGGGMGTARIHWNVLPR